MLLLIECHRKCLYNIPITYSKNYLQNIFLLYKILSENDKGKTGVIR